MPKIGTSSDDAARIEAALIAADIGTWLWDIEHDRVRGDANLDAMFGLASNVEGGRPIADYLNALHPEDIGRIDLSIRQAISGENGDRYEDEYRLVVDGRTRWVLARGIVKRDEQGVARELPGIILDITRQKELNAEHQRLLEQTETQSRIFDTTLSAITDFAYIFDTQGRFIYVNKALLDLWGYKLEQAIGKTFAELPYPAELARQLQRQIQQVIDTGKSLVDETPYTSPSGQAGYYEYIFSPVFDPSGAVEVVAGSTRDITNRKRTEDALRSRTAQFETLLDAAPLGVYLIDADFRVREVNPTARPVFENIPDFIGRDIGEIFHILWPQAYADELIRRFRHTLATGEPDTESELAQERQDIQRKQFYEWQINRIPLDDGSYGVVCYFRDISVQVHARRALEAADRQKNEFLAMLAHELRNPLAPIRNSSELLARTLPADALSQDAVSIIRRQVGQLARLVDDLLDVSRISEGRLNLRLQHLDLASVVGQAVETVAPLFSEKRHDFTLITSYRPLHVMGDPVRLVQCLANILSNAAKYTDPGGHIQLATSRENQEVVISVTDNGIGIHEDLLPRMFNLFVQGDRNLDRSQGGLGLGLALVKRLVEKHGGRVSAANRAAERGAVFEVRLPLVEPRPAAAPTTFQAKAPSRRVLVVDDNTDSAVSLARILQVDGHEIKAAYSGVEAIEQFQQFAPDFVLLDIGLPDIDGYEVARRIRKMEGGDRVRLIALTGYGQEDDRQRALANGFDHHLLKPVDLDVLLNAMSTDVPKGRLQ